MWLQAGLVSAPGGISLQHHAVSFRSIPRSEYPPTLSYRGPGVGHSPVVQSPTLAARCGVKHNRIGVRLMACLGLPSTGRQSVARMRPGTVHLGAVAQAQLTNIKQTIYVAPRRLRHWRNGASITTKTGKAAPTADIPSDRLGQWSAAL